MLDKLKFRMVFEFYKAIKMEMDNLNWYVEIMLGINNVLPLYDKVYLMHMYW